MTLGEQVVVWFMVALTAAALVLLAYVPEINAWERANGYPFGMLCDLYRNCQ